MILSTAGIYQKMFALGICWKCVSVSVCVCVCVCVCECVCGWSVWEWVCECVYNSHRLLNWVEGMLIGRWEGKFMFVQWWVEIWTNDVYMYIKHKMSETLQNWVIVTPCVNYAWDPWVQCTTHVLLKHFCHRAGDGWCRVRGYGQRRTVAHQQDMHARYSQYLADAAQCHA